MADLFLDARSDNNYWYFWDADAEDYLSGISKVNVPDEDVARYVATLMVAAENRGYEYGAEAGRAEVTSELRRLIGAAAESS